MRNTTERSIWQIRGRAAGRSNVDTMLRYGVALIGPGDAGPWSADRSDEEFEGSLVRRFANEVQVGDVVLLRSGRSSIGAIGIVASDYYYLDSFDDVNGLDLQHARRVRWSALPAEYDFHELVFGPTPAGFSRVHDASIRDYVARYLNSPPSHWQEASLPLLPAEEPALDEVPEQIQSTVAQVLDLSPVMQDEERFGALPSEDEMVAHFVVPFFARLGWPPERIGVKWHYIDVALFSSLPRVSETCALVVEAKRLGAGVEGALEQAKAYVLGLGGGRDVVVTDGIRYRLYAADRDFAPIAYANLARLKSSSVELFARLRRS